MDEKSDDQNKFDFASLFWPFVVQLLVLPLYEPYMIEYEGFIG
jgi:hypothetical protein